MPDKTGIVVGMEVKKVVDANLQILGEFQADDTGKCEKMTALLAPFFSKSGIPR
ncbi:MAG: hypothetical protein MZV64_05350 [Ignavibacteriales bacterium]|nr:hypothetical protein [Ignavibacteriales bacterium]